MKHVSSISHIKLLPREIHATSPETAKYVRIFELISLVNICDIFVFQM